MKKVIIGAAALLLLSVQAMAQGHYDPYFALPNAKGTKAADAGLATPDISSIGDVSDIFGMFKFGLSDQLEVGGLVNLGVLNDGADSFDSATIGAKYGLSENSGATVGLLLPVGGADDPGLSLGYQHVLEMDNGMGINNWAQVGLLDGYAPVGVGLWLLVEPYKAINDKLTGYLDLVISTNTDDIGGTPLGINLAPNVDYMLSETAVLNVGVSLGVAGDSKQDDLGAIATLLLKM